jgi:hypothetical protein
VSIINTVSVGCTANMVQHRLIDGLLTHLLLLNFASSKEKARSRKTSHSLTMPTSSFLLLWKCPVSSHLIAASRNHHLLRSQS